MDPKLAKRINTLYRNCKQMPLLCVLSLFVPIVLPFVVPLCLVYASQRRSLLSSLESSDWEVAGGIGEHEPFASKVEFIRANGGRFYLPVAITVVVAAIVAVIVALG